MPTVINNNPIGPSSPCCPDPAASNYSSTCKSDSADRSVCTYPTYKPGNPDFNTTTCTISGTTCLNCGNFDRWNDIYIETHDGQSLQSINNVLWQSVVDLVSNSGRTIYVNTVNGELVNPDCCKQLNGYFENGICFCSITPPPIEEGFLPRCVATLQDILNLISTPQGLTFFNNNFSTIGPSLGLTNTQINFIKTNINAPILNDINNNSIPDSIEARILLNNALTNTGGFFLHFGATTNTPKMITQNFCQKVNDPLPRFGYFNANGNWNGSICMCQPPTSDSQCTIDLTQVHIIEVLDFYNSPIQVVAYSGTTNLITEKCCNRLKIDNPNLSFTWQNQPKPACYREPQENCLPAIFSMGKNQISVPPCKNNLEISMWVYFGKPENPCQSIPEPPETDIVSIDGQYCDITLTPNTSAIVPSLGTGVNLLQPTAGNMNSGAISATTKCCYNINNPIKAQISLTNPTLNSFLIPTKKYNSSLNYFNTWTQIKAELPMSGLTLNLGVNLEITDGLSCCCDYDIFIDDIRVDCNKNVSSMLINNIECPGFDLVKVIDNKKSWVYNPGTAEVGTSNYDIAERQDGSLGLINGEGTINRTFAPSPDAEIPWRYTDYWQQSSVYEKHSNLVLNTKELDLTFDMCAKCFTSTGTTYACPDGYTLSAGTKTCYKVQVFKLFQDGDQFIFMAGDDYLFE